MQEIWKNINGFDGKYQVSNMGRIRNLKMHILRQELDDGYCVVKLSRYGKSKGYVVHRLVCIAFLPNPNNYPMVNHIDSDRTNNNLSNLEWCTHKMNMEHSRLNLRHPRGEDNPHSKISESDAKIIRQLYKKGKSGNCRELAERFNTTLCNVCNIAAGRSWLYI